MIEINSQAAKDAQTVTPQGKTIYRPIDGVILKPITTIEDHRGDIFELWSAETRVSDDAIVHVYETSLRPGAIKGWVVHRAQEDRIHCLFGFMRWVLFDDRPESPTYQTLQIVTMSERNRLIMLTPRGVWHAVQNIGSSDASFINMPNAAYNHADPDKYRLPLKNDLIPFDFSDSNFQGSAFGDVARQSR